MSNQETEQKIGELMDVMARLRGENGCPWDKEQTHVFFEALFTRRNLRAA